MVDNCVKKVSITHISIHTPYLPGCVNALCPMDAIYDLIVGNVAGARTTDALDLSKCCHQGPGQGRRDTTESVGEQETAAG